MKRNFTSDAVLATSFLNRLFNEKQKRQLKNVPTT